MTEHTSYSLSLWQGYLTFPEIDLVKDIARSLPKNPDVLCIGAGAGTVTLSVLEERSDALYYSVDILTNESETTTNEHLRLQETQYGKTGQVIRIWGDSHIVGLRWRVPLDMLVIDGDHSFNGIYGDLSIWYKHVKQGGYILCHDYGSQNWPAVKKVIDGVPKSALRRIQVSDTMIALEKL